MSWQVSEGGAVQTGTWTNWTHGPVFGRTWTTSMENGAYLVAFLALFVRVVGYHFWDILSYILFHVRSTTTQKEDGVFHQEQAILRNASSDASAAWQFLTVGWSWQKKVRGAWIRTLPLVLGAVINILAFGAAGIFVSRVTSNGSEVLLRENTCGLWPDPYAFGQNDVSSEQAVLQDQQWRSNLQNIFTMSSIYAANCYGYDNTTSRNTRSSECNAYGRQWIDWSVDVNSTCPFAPEMCINDLAVRLDTGFIDSHLHLGINAPEQDRVLYRQVLECAPLTTDGFQSKALNVSEAEKSGLSPFLLNSQGGLAAADFIHYNYGPSYTTGTNYTFWYTNTSFASSISPFASPGYLVDVEVSQLRSDGESTFAAIPQMNRTDADVIIVFLMKQTEFVTPFVEADGQMNNYTFYSSRNPVSVLGCASQLQWCNPLTNGLDRCTHLSGSSIGSPLSAMTKAALDIKLNVRQTGVLRRIYYLLWANDLFSAVGYLGYSALLANSAMQSGFGGSLPINQWILEVNHFFGVVLTSTQIQIAQYVAGLTDPSFNKYLVPSATVDTEWMCTNQIVQRDNFASFNIFGLVVILTISSVVIAINLSLDPLIQRLRTRRGRTSRNDYLSWRANNTLHLQSIAYEARRMGIWDRGSTVPVTGGESLGPPIAFSNNFESELNETLPRKTGTLTRHLTDSSYEAGLNNQALARSWWMPRSRPKQDEIDAESENLTGNTSTTQFAIPIKFDTGLSTNDYAEYAHSKPLLQHTIRRKPLPKYHMLSSETSADVF